MRLDRRTQERRQHQANSRAFIGRGRGCLRLVERRSGWDRRRRLAPLYD